MLRPYSLHRRDQADGSLSDLDLSHLHKNGPETSNEFGEYDEFNGGYQPDSLLKSIFPFPDFRKSLTETTTEITQRLLQRGGKRKKIPPPNPFVQSGYHDDGEKARSLRIRNDPLRGMVTSAPGGIHWGWLGCRSVLARGDRETCGQNPRTVYRPARSK